MKIKYRKGTKKVTLLRNLLAKLAYEGSISIEEIYVLFDCHNICVEQAKVDGVFLEKHLNFIEKTETFLKVLNPQSFPVQASGCEKELASILDIIPTKQAYFGWKKSPIGVNPYSISLQLDFPKPKKIIRSWMGKGYRDKGRAKNKAIDGSPSWQDVSSSKAREQRTIEEMVHNVIKWANGGKDSIVSGQSDLEKRKERIKKEA